MDKLCQEVPKQEVDVEGVGLVHVEHHLVNSLHDGKERLAMTQHKVFNLIIYSEFEYQSQVKQYLDQGVAKKPPGFGDRGKVSTQTCQVCLQDPKTYNQVIIISIE